jgi:serine/threonine protein kinase
MDRLGSLLVSIRLFVLFVIKSGMSEAVHSDVRDPNEGHMARLGKYEILEEIGKSDYAVVYRARDTEFDRDVALKVVRSIPIREATFARRFLQEARTSARLQHPHIVTIYDYGDAAGAPYLAMAFIGTGRTLRDLLADEGRLPLERALPILTQLAEALDYLHSRGDQPPLIHRNLKSTNMLLDVEGYNPQVVLTDFGLVRSLESNAEITTSGPILGDPAYMAPEQVDPTHWGPTTPLTDVYALGVVAYEMLTGRLPFTGNMATVLYAHAHVPPPSPLDLAPDLGPELAEVLTQGLAKHPSERYPRAGALVAALRQVAQARAHLEGRQAKLARLLTQAHAARSAEDWLSVQELCAQMLQVERTHSDVLVMMTEAAAELQRAQWYDQAVAHIQTQRWDEACRDLIRALRGRLDYRGGEAAERLLEVAEGLLNQYDHRIRQAHEALALFDALAMAVQEEDWERGIDAGKRLVQLAPDLECPQTWLARARDKLEIETKQPVSLPESRHFAIGDLPPLAILANRYVIMERISRGGTKAIYRAQDQQRHNKVVALKEMAGTAVAPDEWQLALDSFQRMARTLIQLEHPNLAQVADHFQAWGRYYIVTEFIQGQTLAEMLAERSLPFSEEKAVNWAAQLCDVLSYLHSQEPKIIYRGLKPDNVMIETGTDQVKLVSFSIARLFKPGLDKDTLTLGAIGYAAPEQYGTAQTDERTDIYALGVTLHQLLTLHDPTSKMFVFPPVGQLNPRISQRVAQAITKAIRRDPKERFQTALEMKNALL